MSDNTKRRLASWAWLSWQEAETGESYGESTEIEFAYKLAQRLSTEAIIGGACHTIELYQDPGHSLLRRFHADGRIEIFREPTPFSEKAPPPAGGRRSQTFHRPPTRKQREQRNWLIVARRAAVHVPPDGRVYAVALDPETDEGLFVDPDLNTAKEILADWQVHGRTAILVDSRDLETRLEEADAFAEKIEGLEGSTPSEQEIKGKRAAAGLPERGLAGLPYAVALEKETGETLFFEEDLPLAQKRFREILAQGHKVILVDSRDMWTRLDQAQGYTMTLGLAQARYNEQSKPQAS